MSIFYKILELFFALIGGLFFICLNFLSKIENYFHDKLEFEKYSKWLRIDRKFMEDKNANQ